MKHQQKKKGRKPRGQNETDLAWGRPKATKPYVKHANKINQWCKRLNLPETVVTLRAIAAELSRRSGAKIGFGMVYNVFILGNEPQKNEVRLAFGFPALAKAPICPVHNKVCAIQHRPPAPASERPVRRNWKALSLLLVSLLIRKDYNP